MNTQLLKAKEVAERLNISGSQAFTLMRNGDIPTVRFGRRTQVCPKDLEDFIQKSLANPKTSSLKTKLAAVTASMENTQMNQQQIEVTYGK